MYNSVPPVRAVRIGFPSPFIRPHCHLHGAVSDGVYGDLHPRPIGQGDQLLQLFLAVDGDPSLIRVLPILVRLTEKSSSGPQGSVRQKLQRPDFKICASLARAVAAGQKILQLLHGRKQALFVDPYRHRALPFQFPIRLQHRLKGYAGKCRQIIGLARSDAAAVQIPHGQTEILFQLLLRRLRDAPMDQIHAEFPENSDRFSIFIHVETAAFRLRCHPRNACRLHCLRIGTGNVATGADHQNGMLRGHPVQIVPVGKTFLILKVIVIPSPPYYPCTRCRLFL